MTDPRVIFAELLKLAERCVSDTEESDREDAARLSELVLEFGAWVSENKVLKDPKEPPHPMQPVLLDERGMPRFKGNLIVRFLLQAGGYNLNDLAHIPGFGQDDWQQFYQLIGTSVSAYGGHFPGSQTERDAEERADELLAERHQASSSVR